MDSTLQLLHAISCKNDKINAIAFSSHEPYVIACGTEHHYIISWDARTGKEIVNFSTWSPITAICFSQKAKLLASGNMDGAVKIWDFEKKKSIMGFGGHLKCVYSLVFSPDGIHVAAGIWGNTVKLYSTKDGQLHGSFTRKKDVLAVYCVDFSPDGHFLASGSSGTIPIWDVASGKLDRECTGFDQNVYALSFSPDGTMLASGGVDRALRVWDARTCRIIYILKGHERPVKCVRFLAKTPSILVSASIDNTVRFWDITSGTCISTFKAHGDGIDCMALAPDGKTLATGSRDGTVKVWRIEF
jgi:WD40 repeat protein